MNSLTLKSAVLLAGAAFFCFGHSAAARAENPVTFTGGYTTTFSSSDGNFGAGFYGANISGTPSSSRIVSDDFRDEITSDETWNSNAYQVFEMGFSGGPTAQSYLGSFTNLWIWTPGPHPGFWWGPRERFIRGLNVPEGGSPFLYILLAGLSCFGALFVSRRRTRTTQ